MLTVGAPPPSLPLPAVLLTPLPDAVLPVDVSALPAAAPLLDLPILPPDAAVAPQPWVGHLAEALAAIAVPARTLLDLSEPAEADPEAAAAIPPVLAQPWALSLVPELADLPVAAEAAPAPISSARTTAPQAGMPGDLPTAAATPITAGAAVGMATLSPAAAIVADQGALALIAPERQPESRRTDSANLWPPRRAPQGGQAANSAASAPAIAPRPATLPLVPSGPGPAPGAQRMRGWQASLPAVSPPAATAAAPVDAMALGTAAMKGVAGLAPPSGLPAESAPSAIPNSAAATLEPWVGPPRLAHQPARLAATPPAPAVDPATAGPLPAGLTAVVLAQPSPPLVLTSSPVGDVPAPPSPRQSAPPASPPAAIPAAIDVARPLWRSQGDGGPADLSPSSAATTAALPLAPPPLPAAAALAAPPSAPSSAPPAAPPPELALAPTLAIASDRLGAIRVDVSGSPDRLEVSLSATPAAAPILVSEAPRLAQDLAAAGVALASYAVNGQRADVAADTANLAANSAGSSAGSNGTAAGNSQHQSQAQSSPAPSPAPAPEPGRRGNAALRPTTARHTPSPDRFA